jgi:hypothetical protein
VRPEIRPLSSLVRQPTLLRVVEKRRRLVDRLSTVGPAWRDAVNAAASLANGSRDDTDVDVVFWSGGKDSYLALLMLESCLVASGAENRRVVLLTTFDKSTGLLAHQGLHCQDIMAQVGHNKDI